MSTGGYGERFYSQEREKERAPEIPVLLRLAENVELSTEGHCHTRWNDALGIKEPIASNYEMQRISDQITSEKSKEAHSNGLTEHVIEL